MARPKKRLAARLRVPVQILSPPAATDDEWVASGEWPVLIAETRAEIWGEKGAEGVEDMADADRITHHARVRYHAGITSSCRVKNLADGNTYEVVFMTDVDYRHHEIIMDLRQL